jgi:hypothetical protein
MEAMEAAEAAEAGSQLSGRGRAEDAGYLLLPVVGYCNGG